MKSSIRICANRTSVNYKLHFLLWVEENYWTIYVKEDATNFQHGNFPETLTFKTYRRICYRIESPFWYGSIRRQLKGPQISTPWANHEQKEIISIPVKMVLRGPAYPNFNIQCSAVGMICAALNNGNMYSNLRKTTVWFWEFKWDERRSSKFRNF